ncbi:MAG: hypothetical protein KC517_09360 [Bacteroidetes bacterium]|nr:hypothetical protein [Bacteroidota bacterium]
MRVCLKPQDFNKKAYDLDGKYFGDYDYSDIPTLFEAEDVKMCDIFEIDGEYFMVDIICPKYNFAGAEKIKINTEPEAKTIEDDRIKCPVCESVDQDSWELSDENDEYECSFCGAEMSFTSELTRTFYITLKKSPKIKTIKNK